MIPQENWKQETKKKDIVYRKRNQFDFMQEGQLNKLFI